MATSLQLTSVVEPAVASPGPRVGRWRWWLLWLAAFYAVWSLLNFGLGYWVHTREHWQIALAMALGSFVAGSTPMGGGTVGFPVLVLLFDQPAAFGRNFSFVIQSIGMTSASIFIVVRRIPVEWRVLRYATLGAAAGLVFGTLYVVPRLGDSMVKLIFACLWASFGLLTLAKNGELCSFQGLPEITRSAAAKIGVAIGLVGGTTAALTGVGIDMALYTVLVLLYRMDLKVAVPTSVVIMALTSVMGSALHFVIGDLEREVILNWMAAAPVVILGAPLGSYFVNVVPRKGTLYFVAVLCILQFFWTLRQVGPSAQEWLFVLASLSIATGAFVLLYRTGRRLSPRDYRDVGA